MAKATTTSTRSGSKKRSIGEVAMSALAQNKSTEAVIKEVKRVHPESVIGPAAVSWYRGKLAKRHHVVKSQAAPKAKVRAASHKKK